MKHEPWLERSEPRTRSPRLCHVGGRGGMANPRGVAGKPCKQKPMGAWQGDTSIACECSKAI